MTTSVIHWKMYALILLQCIQDYNYLQYYLYKKTHCPSLASYKQSVQVDTSCSSTEADTGIASL